MFKPQNKIIIVDDDDRDLMTLSKVFLNSGIGCRTIKYDEMYDSPLMGVRIAFFDINLTNKTIDLSSGNTVDYKTDRTISAIFNDLAVAIESCIHKENGPYALIFWSSNTQFVENFIKYVNDGERGFTHLSAPIIIKGIDKGQFMTDVDNIDGIQTEIEKIIKGSSIELLFDFENNATLAATETINNIYNLLPKEDEWGEIGLFDDNFEKIFSKIAISSLGFEKGKENPDKAIVESLIPIHNHFLQKNIDKKWFNYLKKLSQANSFKDISMSESSIESKLNTFFHIETNLPMYCNDVRGCVFYINDCNIDFKKYFGYSQEQCKKYILDIKDSELIKKSKFIAVEISSVCDYAQNKPRINKFILGLKTPKLDAKKYNTPAESTLTLLKNNSFYDGEEVFQVWFNFNKVFSVYENDVILNNPIFIFKKEIMDMIGNRYANHVSRIGITSF